MSIRTLSTYFAKGTEPYTCPNSTQNQIFNYPVVANSTVALNDSATVSGGLIADTITCNSSSWFNNTLS
ncbi:MAG: hypothetical protein WCJ33_09535, partial [Pseudomonadota bacterium]